MDSNNGEVLRQWCLAGHGLALKSLWEIADDLNAGRLEILLPDHPPPGHAIYALYPQNRFLSSRVRVFIDYLAEIYGPVPPWERGEDRCRRKWWRDGIVFLSSPPSRHGYPSKLTSPALSSVMVWRRPTIHEFACRYPPSWFRAGRRPTSTVVEKTTSLRT
jgi:hypothetical protein